MLSDTKLSWCEHMTVLTSYNNKYFFITNMPDAKLSWCELDVRHIGHHMLVEVVSHPPCLPPKRVHNLPTVFKLHHLPTLFILHPRANTIYTPSPATEVLSLQARLAFTKRKTKRSAEFFFSCRKTRACFSFTRNRSNIGIPIFVR